MIILFLKSCILALISQILFKAPFLSILKSKFRLPQCMHNMCLLIYINFQNHGITREREREREREIGLTFSKKERGAMKPIINQTVCMELSVMYMQNKDNCLDRNCLTFQLLLFEIRCGPLKECISNSCQRNIAHVVFIKQNTMCIQ